ncbi:HAD domain-containing protein [Dioscorea alata]|uniref:HAD domain-containing protein n=1 Tax=Dioscorea alata TaxID=55571 RepID=A0ACB7TTT8_DIOAL|nr:HAD domain-containing protein [Dioscorea alata]
MEISSLSDMVMEFFEERETKLWPETFLANNGRDDDDDGDDDEHEDQQQRKAFWEEQNQLLQEALSRSCSLETRIRMEIEKSLRKLREEGLVLVCVCSNRGNTGECRNCLMSFISNRLKDAGFNSALCLSKWRRSPDIPSGEHSFIDAVMESKNGKRGPVRVVIELNFKAEFEMARASEEYNMLVNRLPEVFVGKTQKLGNVIKIMCGAAKKCMKDNKMHMAPWRKHKYMQSKWLSSCERMPRPGPLPISTVSGRQPKPRASMLTFDLHCTAVEVV